VSQTMADHSATAQFTFTDVADAVAATMPDRPLIMQGERTYTYAEVVERSKRLAAYLHDQGLGCHTERMHLADHEAGQDLLGFCAYNGNEFVEGLLGAFRARVAPFNINFRYVENELQYVLDDAGATALVYHAAFAPRIAEVLPELPKLRVLIQIADDSGNELLPGAVDYETIVTTNRVTATALPAPSADDLHIIYTGGTTGKPKGVLWRQHDIFMGACGGRDMQSGQTVGSYDEIVTRAEANPGLRLMVVPPLIHGAAQFGALTAMTSGQTLIFSSDPSRIDADEIVADIERARAAVVMVVGDAMARPLVAALEKTTANVSSLIAIGNGGAVLSPAVKERLVAAKPGLAILDGVGSSETGAQMQHVSTSGAISTGIFAAGPDTCVLDDEQSRVLDPGHDHIGWLAQRRYAPLGYKGDPTKTAACFLKVDGERYVLPGDRARHLADGTIELLGRDAATINSGGEKIFAEEVEMAVSSHPAVADVVVAGRSSQRWGQEVVAIVALADGATADPDALIAHAAQSIARYKLPKAVVFRAEIQRSPAGKSDYRWARAQAEDHSRSMTEHTYRPNSSVRPVSPFRPLARPPMNDPRGDPMNAAETDVAAELEAIKALKARYCRFLDIKDFDSWRGLFTDDVQVRLEMSVSTGRTDAEPVPTRHGIDELTRLVIGSVENAATVHHCHTPEITLVSARTAHGIWAMQDHLVFPDNREVRGAGHYHETYEKRDGSWRITSLHLTRTLLQTMGDWSGAF